MKKGLFLLFVLLVLGSSDCFSQSDRWVYYSESESAFYYYDSKTIKYENDCVTVFVKKQYIEREYDEYARKYMDYVIQKQKIYCSESKIKVIDVIIYYTDDTLDRKEINIELDIIPDSIGEALFLSVCK